ncbi:MAG: formate dehydrogenase subunit gamma [Gemmatimonadetes bacterium]|nr:formate dehydrogenase subunit gamma [Gemmatimonadota bacterium]
MRHGEIQRFTFLERIVHWVVGLSFLFLLLTGLAFSHPRLFWLTTLAGGGATARILHPWMGVAFTVGGVAMFFLWIRDMRIDAADREWLKAIRYYAVHDKARVPAAGKYNAGQKMFFWTMTALGAAYLVSGVPMWMPGGVLGVGPFYGGIVNAMRLVHYMATVGGGLLLIVHVYLGTVAYPGTLGAMLHGSVTRGWAKLHHPRWHGKESGR